MKFLLLVLIQLYEYLFTTYVPLQVKVPAGVPVPVGRQVKLKILSLGPTVVC
eukprot:SAG31_NODE_443_length_15645_cov_51.693169_9_plen_52_part_00